MKREHSSRKGILSDAKLAELRHTHDANERALKENLHDRDWFFEGLQSQLKASDDSESGQHSEFQKWNIVLYYGTWAVASKSTIFLGLRERLQNSEERADRLYAWGDLQSNSRTKKITSLKSTNAGLRAEIAELISKAKSERAKLQQELQKKRGGTVLQNKTVASLKSTVPSVTTDAVSLPSVKEILRYQSE